MDVGTTAAHILKSFAAPSMRLIMRIEKCAPGAAGSNVRHIRRSHPSNGEFRRMIAFVYGKFQKAS